MRRLADDRGAATVVLVSMLVLLLALTAAVLQMTNRGGAGAGLGSGRPGRSGCRPRRAVRAGCGAVARANGAALVTCEQAGPDFSVRAERDVLVLAGRHVRLEALARAGPPDQGFGKVATGIAGSTRPKRTQEARCTCR